MENPIPDTPPSSPQQSAKDQIELIKFLREESAANRSALSDEYNSNRAALREQADADRKLLQHTLWIVSVPLTILIALFGWFGIKDIGAIESRAKATLDATLEQNKAAAALERQKGQEAVNEIRAESRKTSDAEIARADKALQAKFSDENIQNTIEKAAKNATEGKAKTLIEDRVRAITEPIQQQAQAQLASIHTQELIARVNADDAKAFDELVQTRDKGDTTRQALIQRVVEDKHRNNFLSLLSGAAPTSCESSSASFRGAMASSDVWIRKGAVENCLSLSNVEQRLRGEAESFGLDLMGQIPPILVNIAINDPSLVVRRQAVYNFNELFQNSPGYPSNGFDLLDPRDLSKWWEENKSHFKELQMLSFSETAQGIGLNTIRLYDEVERTRNAAPPFLQKDFKATLDRMQSLAIRHNSDPLPALEKNMGRNSCSDVIADFLKRLKSDSWTPERELAQSQSPDYGMWELQYLKTCEPPADPLLLKQVSALMVHTHLLERRYGATMIVNRWTGSNLDPFDTKEIQGWWVQHKSAWGN